MEPFPTDSKKKVDFDKQKNRQKEKRKRGRRKKIPACSMPGPKNITPGLHGQDARQRDEALSRSSPPSLNFPPHTAGSPDHVLLRVLRMLLYIICRRASEKEKKKK
jgi:hypothetical protein